MLLGKVVMQSGHMRAQCLRSIGRARHYYRADAAGIHTRAN